MSRPAAVNEVADPEVWVEDDGHIVIRMRVQRFDWFRCRLSRSDAIVLASELHRLIDEAE